MDLSGFNIWELLVAAASTFLIGFVWYGNILFGQAWHKLAGLTDEQIKNANMPLIFGLSFVLFLIIALFLSIFTEIAMMIGTSALWAGLLAALICLGLVATSIGVNYLFARKPLKLFLIDAGYLVITFFIMGLIIGAWH